MLERPRPAELPITEDDAFIATALKSASIPTLLASVVHMTGDTSLLRGPIRPGRATLGEAQGFLSEEDKESVRALALEAIRAYRDRGCTLPPALSAETIHELMSFVVGEPVPDEYVPMMMEELALDDDHTRDVHWDDTVSAAARERLRVVIVGAGMSGLLAAIRLNEAGIPFVVIEKNERVGGTWHENTYPGCRVDIANHFYCYSFEPNHDWSEFYSRQPELAAYFERCVDKYGIRDKIRFRTEVVSATFDAAASQWWIRLRDGAGSEEEMAADVLISGVGQLNRPMIPDIPGRASFHGPAFHSARWEHEHDLCGRHVAVIGTGASAFQLVPELAKTAAHVTVFQRTPAWMVPNPNYHRRVSDGTKWLLKHLPYYGRWYRFLIFWPGSDGLLPSLIVDPSWPHPQRSVNAANEEMRVAFTEYMRSQVGDDVELLEKVVPKYPPFGKRMLQDNGTWLATLRRDNVTLVTEPIERIDEDAIVCAGAARHPVDAIVFATGFHANKFLWPMEIRGRDGALLSEVWGDDPKAYLGITVPGFPNLFCLYGPATNLAHAGSIIFHSECQVRYVMGCLKALLQGDLATMECKASVCADFNERLEAALARTVWAHPGMNSWYKNARGRVTTTSPWRLVDYWGWTKEPDLDDYVVTRRLGGAA